jgi:hypothetical protein
MKPEELTIFKGLVENNLMYSFENVTNYQNTTSNALNGLHDDGEIGGTGLTLLTLLTIFPTTLEVLVPTPNKSASNLSDGSKPRWTIDVPKEILGLKNGKEIKFK